jgi:FkbM family methyltransferase
VEKEPFTVEWIEDSIRPGDVFYDIGANVGAYSLIAAKATGNRARVYAIEPWASSFNDLSRNVLLNGCGQSVVCLPLALWSDNRPLHLSPSVHIAGAAQHHISIEDANQTDTVCVLGVRLDDLVERFGLPPPTHAKIDTDGCELEALLGAERTLGSPEWRSILLELDSEETARNREIKKLLTDSGFDAGHRHERLPTPSFPDPKGRPDVYWTFWRLPARANHPRPQRPRLTRKTRTTLRRAQQRAVTATLTVIMFLFLLLVLLPEELGDRPYDVFGLKF